MKIIEKMPHNDRPIMKPLLISTFDQVFEAISSQPNKEVIGLKTTGGVHFNVQAITSTHVGRLISLPHNNRIYPCCWGNTNNHMGKEGQRIGHYTRPIDAWYQNYNKNK